MAALSCGSWISAKSTRRSATASAAAEPGTSTHFTVLESPPLRSIQLIIASELISVKPGETPVLPLQSAPVRIGESVATSIALNGVRGVETIPLPIS
jgi:hypothetical protein